VMLAARLKEAQAVEERRGVHARGLFPINLATWRDRSEIGIFRTVSIGAKVPLQRWPSNESGNDHGEPMGSERRPGVNCGG
jgi:hypothetical protein